MRAHAVARWLPGVAVARRYERSWVRDDVIAGLVLTTLLVPAGMGYAQAAGLPPETGLYATVVPLFAYALFGPSRILVMGPDSAIAPIIAATVIPLADGDPDRLIALAGLLALLVGAVLVIGGLLRLGFVTDLLSKPIRIGYLNGVAAVVVIGQLPALLGFSVASPSLIGKVEGVVTGIREGLVDPTALAIGVGALVVIVVMRIRHTTVPGVAVALVGAALITTLFGLSDTVPVVAALPRGLPAPALEGLRPSDLTDLLAPALGISLIAFADTGVLSRTFAARRGETVDGSVEMRAIGVANVASGLGGGFPISASASRTPVAEEAGARTQLAAVVAALLIIAFVLIAPRATEWLPRSALAAVVIVAACSLVDVRGLVWLARVDPVEAALSACAFVAVITIGVLQGIAVAIGLSLIAFVNHAWRPYRAELGRIPAVRGYHDMSRHPDAERVPGVVIVRFDAPLFFANGGMFDDFVRAVVDVADDVHTVILAAEPITGLDATAVDELVELDDFLRSRRIRLVIAEMKGPVKDQLQRYRLHDRFSPDRFMPTVGAAVDAITGEFRSDFGPPAP